MRSRWSIPILGLLLVAEAGNFFLRGFNYLMLFKKM
jgi:hypothetical protein